MHPKNRHQDRYDFKKLIQNSPELGSFVAMNKYGDESIDFANPKAVRALNRALLKAYYALQYWDIPEGNLCPPIPGRADYIHHIAELLGYPSGKGIKGLDIGVGANCIYPIIGHFEYGWSFVGADINPKSIESANKIITLNSQLSSVIELRLQSSSKNIFKNIIQSGDQFDFTLCNPPFHASLEEAQKGSRRKWKNLGKPGAQLHEKQLVNFGGVGAELWCEGGELAFILLMISESEIFQDQCRWFSTLVSREDSLSKIQHALKKANVKKIQVLEMSQGQKKSRVVAWSYR